MTLNYWIDIWEPMTRQHYEQGGCYREVMYEHGMDGHVVCVTGRVLSVDEAVTHRVGTVEVIYSSEDQND